MTADSNSFGPSTHGPDMESAANRSHLDNSLHPIAEDDEMMNHVDMDRRRSTGKFP